MYTTAQNYAGKLKRKRREKNYAGKLKRKRKKNTQVQKIPVLLPPLCSVHFKQPPLDQVLFFLSSHTQRAIGSNTKA